MITFKQFLTEGLIETPRSVTVDIKTEYDVESFSLSIGEFLNKYLVRNIEQGPLVHAIAPTHLYDLNDVHHTERSNRGLWERLSKLKPAYVARLIDSSDNLIHHEWFFIKTNKEYLITRGLHKSGSGKIIRVYGIPVGSATKASKEIPATLASRYRTSD